MAVGRDENLFCQIALEHGFITQDDVDRCRNAQLVSGSKKPLVIQLIDSGTLDDKKLQTILELVDRAGPQKRSTGSRPGPDVPRFGEIAVQMGFTTQEAVREAMRRQRKEAARGRAIRLGQILGERGHLEPVQIEQVLAAQSKKVLRCSGCKTKFNISNYDPDRAYTCRKCGFPLDPTQPVGTISAVRTLPATATTTVEEVGTSLIGRKVGDYEIVEMVGEGGMAEVYKVIDPASKTIRALKVLKATTEFDRFKREIKSIRRLEHPNIIRIYDDGIFEGKPYFFMDFVDGEALSEHMDRAETTVVEALEILRQIARGLEAAHASGIVHRDIKPSNVLLDSDADGNLLVKITDFGIARSATDTQVTVEGELLGTFKYMSPEYIKGMAIDGRSDLFSLGVIAYELLTGREPFEVDAPVGYLFVNIKEEPPPIYQVNRDLPRKLDLVVQKALSKTPEIRYTANRFARDVAIYQDFMAGKGELVETEDPESVFYISGGKRLLFGIRNLFGFGRGAKTVVHHAALVEDQTEEFLRRGARAPADGDQAPIVPGETEALDFSQEARIEYEWAMQLLAEGNVSRARQSLKALVDLADPSSPWGYRASEKLRELDSAPAAAGAATLRPALDESGDSMSRSGERELYASGSGESDLVKSDLGRKVREEDLKTSQMILTDTASEVVADKKAVDIQLAQESLISAKTFIDKVQSLEEYERQRSRLEAIFERIAGTPWEKEIEDELAEVLFKWGRFLIGHRRIQEGIDRYWQMVERFPRSRWSVQVVEVLAELERPEGMTLVKGASVARPNGGGGSTGSAEFVFVPPFYIDVYPVTNAAYKEFIDATGHAAPRHWKNRIYPLGKGNHPVVFVTYDDALAHASWREKRLPTDEEWTLAAGGEDRRNRWPWGSQFDQTRCNSRALGIGDTTPVGQFPTGRTPAGCHDAIGNVWEWTDSWYDSDRTNRVLRGGSWFTYPEFTYIDYRKYERPTSRTRLYGFRCSRNFKRPESPA